MRTGSVKSSGMRRIPRGYLVTNLVLGVVAVLLVAGIYRELTTQRQVPPSTVRPARAAPRPATPMRSSPDGRPADYAVVFQRNLFSPTRTEVAGALPTPPPPPAPKPILHGVMLAGKTSRAYLEDPITRKTVGYAEGDSVGGGGQIEKILGDRVYIARAEGRIEVLLRDPGKPRPVVASTPPGPGGAGHAAPPGARPAVGPGIAPAPPPPLSPPGGGGPVAAPLPPPRPR